jgi:hypothetical protein
VQYRGYSKFRTHTAPGSYSRAMPRRIRPSWGRCVSLLSSNPCTCLVQSTDSRGPPQIGFAFDLKSGLSQLIDLKWNEYRAIATSGVHRLVVLSRGCPWLELLVPSVPGRPILHKQHVPAWSSQLIRSARLRSGSPSISSEEWRSTHTTRRTTRVLRSQETPPSQDPAVGLSRVIWWS